MENFISGSKYVLETISIVVSFADLLSPGDTISGLPAITVSVASGTDTNPANLLYMAAIVRSGQTVEQRFRLGLPGVIYYINFTVGTTLGDRLSKECYLALLPDEGAAIPTWLPLWESTQLYPVEAPLESVQGSSLFLSGTLITVVINYAYGPEELQGSAALYTGTLVVVVLTYDYSFEAIQGSSSFISGTLVVVVIPYDYSHEDLKGNAAFLSGTLVVVVIPYSYSFEAIQGSASFTSGTLV